MCYFKLFMKTSFNEIGKFPVINVLKLIKPIFDREFYKGVFTQQLI